MTVKKGSYLQSNPYASRNSWQPTAKPYAASGSLSSYSSIPQKPAVNIDFKKGDMVLHTAFGKGMVLSVMKMGGDALLEIAFDEIGTKKLMAKTAAAHLKHL